MSRPAHITLALSPRTGITAIATGERYDWAITALTTCGFRPQKDGTHTLPLEDPPAIRDAIADLTNRADDYRTSLTLSARPYIGDTAQDIASRLPGHWTAAVEIYRRPIWQHDLLPALWDSGELLRTIRAQQVPYAATLTDASGTELLLVERPGYLDNYLVGALKPRTVQEDVNESGKLRSIVLPSAPDAAAHALAGQFLPAYQRALNALRLATVTRALARLREEHRTLQAISDSGRYSDASPLKPGALAQMTDQFREHAWDAFGTVLDHAPALLAACRPAATAWPEDAAALQRLSTALKAGETVRHSCGGQPRQPHDTAASAPPEGSDDVKRDRDNRLWSAVDVWLTHADVFLRQTQTSTSAPLHGPAPAHALPALPAAARTSHPR
ncbi:hypothetical protein [Streptomyces albus]|uniref:hypothetical protein n=1 Tax=Streptomyces albus TaxID=1888 RepID=UPI003F1D1852